MLVIFIFDHGFNSQAYNEGKKVGRHSVSMLLVLISFHFMSSPGEKELSFAFPE